MRLFGISLLFSLSCFAKNITVAVVDTGVMSKVLREKKNPLCTTGSKDFTGTGLEDNLGHGTNILGIIDQEAKKTPYCSYMIKYTDKQYQPIDFYIKALKYAIDLNPTIINLSLGSNTPDLKEQILIKRALDKGIIIVAAAGNDGKELGSNGVYYYPAQVDRRVIVVGALTYRGHRALFSNFGSVVDFWQIGVARQGTLSNIPMSGTSQAAASQTGTIVYLINKGLYK